MYVVVEVACGREGPEAADLASKKLSGWATSPQARRAVLHAVGVLSVAQRHSVSREAPPHVSVLLDLARTKADSHAAVHCSLPSL